MPHLFQMTTREEMIADDPFSGEGVFLPCTGPGEEILEALVRCFGKVVPAVAWDERGAWVHTGSVPDAEDRWRERHARNP